MPRSRQRSPGRKVDVEIIGIHSFSGGAGKSVVASLLALERSSHGRTTYVIDTDLVGLGHLRSLYHEVPEPSSQVAITPAPSFWSVAVEGISPPEFEMDAWIKRLKRVEVPTPSTTSPGAPPESSRWKGASYEVLPNLPPSGSFPATCREIFLSNFHVGFVLERLGELMSRVIAHHVHTAGGTTVALTFVLDCSPFVTALAEDIFLWLSYLALTGVSGDKDSGLLDDVCFASARQFPARLEQLLDQKPHWDLTLACRPLIVVIPDPYFGYPGRTSALLSGPVFHQAQGFASELLRSRLFRPDADPGRRDDLIGRTFPDSSLFLANRGSAGGPSSTSHLVVPENRHLLARPEIASDQATSPRDHIWGFVKGLVTSSAKITPSLRLFDLWFDLDYALAEWRMIQADRPPLVQSVKKVLASHSGLSTALTSGTWKKEWATFTEAIQRQTFTPHGKKATPTSVLPPFFARVVATDPWCILLDSLTTRLGEPSTRFRDATLAEILGEPLERVATVFKEVVSDWLVSHGRDAAVTAVLAGDDEALLVHLIRAVRDHDVEALPEVLAFWFRKEVVKRAQECAIHPGLREILAPADVNPKRPPFAHGVEQWLDTLKEPPGRRQAARGRKP